MTAAAPPRPAHDRLPEIQGLRALAVALVVAFHFWPGRVPGGYIGVDVFFVISGYLITSHLVRETDATGRLDVPAFWARRIRRLIPASLLVLLVTSAGILAFVPRAYWTQFLQEVIGAAGYVVNWVLAASAVDYLGSANHPSPVQHYWSLSVEEQFYAVWPLLILGAIVVAARVGARSRRAIAGTLAVLSAASLVASIVLTATTPAAAYFITPTRVWEFGAGGLLSLVPLARLRHRPQVAAAASWTGLAAVLVAAFAFTGATPFPGVAAALPVVGAALLIAAGSPSVRWAPSWLLGVRPAQFVGDISYSIYLWHWPLLIIVPFALGHALTLPEKLALLAVTVLLAWGTKVLVEDPFRRAQLLASRRAWVTLTSMVAAVALVIAGPAIVVAHLNAQVAQQQAAINHQVALANTCFGAHAMHTTKDCSEQDKAPLVPSRATVYDDTQGAFHCYDQSPGAKLSHCAFGSNAPDALRMAVVGDSHGAMLLPALRDIAKKEGWHVDAYVGRGCVWSQSDLSDTADPCYPRNAAMQQLLTTGPKFDVVLVTSRRDLHVLSGQHTTLFATAASQWAPVAARGTKIIALADNPLVPAAKVDCVVDAPSDAAARTCAFSAHDGFELADGLYQAARSDPDVKLINLRSSFCTSTTCPMVIGGVVVYRDRDHMTATFSRSLEGYLGAAIVKAIR